jgi:hypothetical protein
MSRNTAPKLVMLDSTMKIETIMILYNAHLQVDIVCCGEPVVGIPVISNEEILLNPYLIYQLFNQCG